MSKAHYDEETGLFIEDHPKQKMVKAYFTRSTVEEFATFGERTKIVDVLFKEVSKIPSDWIPYGTFFHDEWMFVYSSAWDEEEQRYVLLIDLASTGQIVGLIPSIEDLADEDETGPVFH